ncbi:MAG: DUF29 domain-containing protein [Cyanobacteria bacterium P01_G01_bin.49]
MQSLYETDFGQWLEKQAIALSERKPELLDWDNLLEEIETLGRTDKRAINSLSRQLLTHLLLYRFWTDHRERYLSGWAVEIRTFRDDLKDFTNPKTWFNYFVSQLDKNYAKARNLAILKAKARNLTISPDFPQECPFIVEQLLEDDFYGI